jgi:hypothetical protein
MEMESSSSSSPALAGFMQSLLLDVSSSSLRSSSVSSAELSETESEYDLPIVAVAVDRAIQPHETLLQQQRYKTQQKQREEEGRCNPRSVVLRHHSQPILPTRRNGTTAIIDRWAASSSSSSSSPSTSSLSPQKATASSRCDNSPISPIRRPSDSNIDRRPPLYPSSDSVSSKLDNKHKQRCLVERNTSPPTHNSSSTCCRWTVSRNNSDSALLKVPQRFPELQPLCSLSFDDDCEEKSDKGRSTSSFCDATATTARPIPPTARAVPCCNDRPLIRPQRTEDDHDDDSTLDLHVNKDRSDQEEPKLIVSVDSSFHVADPSSPNNDSINKPVPETEDTDWFSNVIPSAHDVSAAFIGMLLVASQLLSIDQPDGSSVVSSSSSSSAVAAVTSPRVGGHDGGVSAKHYVTVFPSEIGDYKSSRNGLLASLHHHSIWPSYAHGKVKTRNDDGDMNSEGSSSQHHNRSNVSILNL